MREETFGPVCSFIGYRSKKKKSAGADVDASPYGLAASVWSDNIRQALHATQGAIEAGIT